MTAVDTPEQGTKPEHEAKKVTIVINGRPKVVTKTKLTFEEVVSLAFDGSPPTGENIVFTVTYRRGPSPKPEGSMVPGDTVKVKDRMIFNVTATDKS